MTCERRFAKHVIKEIGIATVAKNYDIVLYSFVFYSIFSVTA